MTQQWYMVIQQVVKRAQCKLKYYSVAGTYRIQALKIGQVKVLLPLWCDQLRLPAEENRISLSFGL